MSYPKLSAVLNNCPLHALTPEIKAEVIRFAEIKGYNNSHNAKYERLKDTFATFYGLDPSMLSWEQFAELLIKYNSYDTQILLGPVLRSFMKAEIATDENTLYRAIAADKTPEQYLNDLTEINPHDARYFSLSPDELSAYVGTQLGFNIEYHPQVGLQRTLPAANPICTVNIFHLGSIEGAQAGGHWERTAGGAESINDEMTDTTQLRHIANLLGNDIAVNPVGINLLKEHINLTLNEQAIVEAEISSKAYAELALTAAQISKYLTNIGTIPQDLAIKLLGGNLTERTQAFITNYTSFVPIAQDDYNARYVRASPAMRALMNPSSFEKTLLDYVLQPVSMPEPAVRRLAAYKAAKELEDKGISELPDLSPTSDGEPSDETLSNSFFSEEHPSVDDLDDSPRAKDSDADEQHPINNRPHPANALRTSDQQINDHQSSLIDNPQPKRRKTESVKLSAKETALEEAKNNFFAQLAILALKRDELLERSETDAHDAAKRLHDGLYDAGLDYFYNKVPNATNYPYFKRTCDALFAQERPALETNRDNKLIIANILLSLTGIYLIAATINYAVTGRFGFFPTDSAKKADAVEESIKKIGPVTKI